MKPFSMIKIIFCILVFIWVAQIAIGADAMNVKLIGSYKTNGMACGVAIQGKYAYIADYFYGLYVLDINTVSNPIKVGYCDTPGNACDVAVNGNYAYVADGSSGLRVIDITTASNPIEVGSCATNDAYELVISGSYAYIADYNTGLKIIDINNPANPIEVGSWISPSKAMCIAKQDNYVYLGCSTSGVRIIDVTNPTIPIEVGYYDTLGSAYGIAVSGDYAYVSSYTTGLRILEIGNPRQPIEVGYLDTPGSGTEVAVQGNYAYITDGYSGVRVINISNLRYPIEVGYYAIPGYALSVVVQGNEPYVAASYSGLYILQFYSTLNGIPDIKLINGTTASNLLDLDKYNRDTSATEWSWSSKTTFANITINSEHQVSYQAPLSSTAGQDTVSFTALGMGEGRSILKYSTYLLNRFPDVLVDDGYPISNGHLDLNQYTQNIDIATPLFYQTQLRCNVNRDTARLKLNTNLNSLTITSQIAPTEVGFNEVSKNAIDTFVQGNYAYVADYYFGLYILDVSNPQSPYIVSSCATPGNPRDIFVNGDYAYIADNYDGLRIIDVSNPFHPYEIGADTSAYYAYGLYIRDKYAYVVYGQGYWSHLGIFDVSDPTNPIFMDSYYTIDVNDMNGIFVKDDYAYVANSFAGLKIFNIADPHNIQLAASYHTGGEAWNVFVKDDYAYLADENSLCVFDVSTPSSPKLVGTYYTPRYEYSVYIDNHYAYLGDGPGGLRVVDISTPSSPIEISYLDTSGDAANVFVNGDYAYVSDYTSGLRIIEVGPHAAALRSPAKIIVTATPDTASNDWDKEVINIYEIANGYSQFSTSSDTSHWYFEPYGDSIYPGVLSWISTYECCAITQAPGQKGKLSQIFTVPYPGWYTAKAKIRTDIAEVSNQQKVYLYLYEYNQVGDSTLRDTEIIASGSQVIYAGNGGFGDVSTGKELEVSFYAQNTMLGIQLVCINPISSGVWGSLYLDDLWVYPAEPQVERCYGATNVAMLNPSFDENTVGWILERYGESLYAGVWTTAYSMLCLTQYGGNKGKASQSVQLPYSGRNACASVWVYSDAVSRGETQKVYLYLYSYPPEGDKIIESGNVVLYPGKWESNQWNQLKVAYTPMTEYAVVQAVGINPINNSWATLYFDEVSVNQDQDLPYYWDHALF
ncbi:MAG: LVIVD repeat-containing protein [bacterium]